MYLTNLDPRCPSNLITFQKSVESLEITMGFRGLQKSKFMSIFSMKMSPTRDPVTLSILFAIHVIKNLKKSTSCFRIIGAPFNPLSAVYHGIIGIDCTRNGIDITAPTLSGLVSEENKFHIFFCHAFFEFRLMLSLPPHLRLYIPLLPLSLSSDISFDCYISLLTFVSPLSLYVKEQL